MSNKTKPGKTKQVAIRNGAGQIKGYLMMHWAPGIGWVSIPNG